MPTSVPMATPPATRPTGLPAGWRFAPDSGCSIWAPGAAGRASTWPARPAAASCWATCPARTWPPRLPRRCAVLAADAARLPLRAASFDAIIHADLLCCLSTERHVLAECRRLLHPGGRLGFFTIQLSPGLSSADRRRAVQAGPPAVDTTTSYPGLLAEAGFTAVEQEDLTGAYLHTARGWLHHEQQFATQLSSEQPAAQIGDRLRQRRLAVEAIEAGLLRRSLFTARP